MAKTLSQSIMKWKISWVLYHDVNVKKHPFIFFIIFSPSNRNVENVSLKFDFFFNLKILPSINLDNSNKWGNKKINNFTHWKLHVNICINNCYLTIILFQFICFVCISNSKFWLRNKYLKYFLFNFENWIIKVIFLIKN